MKRTRSHHSRCESQQPVIGKHHYYLHHIIASFDVHLTHYPFYLVSPSLTVTPPVSPSALPPAPLQLLQLSRLPYSLMSVKPRTLDATLRLHTLLLYMKIQHGHSPGWIAIWSVGMLLVWGACEKTSLESLTLSLWR